MKSAPNTNNIDTDWQQQLILQRLNRAGDYTLFLMKSLFILNFAAILAILTFIGNNNNPKIFEQDGSAQILCAIYMFVAGIVSILASTFIFLFFLEAQMQKTDFGNPSPQLGNISKHSKTFTMVSAYLFGIASVFFFVWGSIKGAKAIL